MLPAPPSSVSLNSETIISGLNQPTAIEWTPNGDRFFIAEKGGVIKVSQNGQVLNTPFIVRRSFTSYFKGEARWSIKLLRVTQP